MSEGTFSLDMILPRVQNDIGYWSVCCDVGEIFLAYSVNPDQTPRSAASDQGLQSLHELLLFS